MKLFGGNGSGKDKNRYTSEDTPETWPDEWFEQAGNRHQAQPEQKYTQQRQLPPQEPPRQRPVQENYRRPAQRPVQDSYPQRPVQDNYRQRPAQRPIQENQQRQTRRQYPDYYEDEFDPVRGGGKMEDEEPPKKKGRAGRAVLTVFLVLALLCGAAFAYWKISTKPPDTGVKAPDNDDLTTVDDPGDKTPTYQEERYYTLLVVGDDQEGGNTDTMMLVRFDTVDLTANVVNIPRDTIVNNPWNNKKINSVYHNAEDGMEALKDEIENISGIRPNNYIMVDTDVFIDVVDAMGGVDFYVPFDMDYDDWGPPGSDYYFGIHLQEGMQTLNGYDALGVFRWRQNTGGAGHHYDNPDIDRISTQHDLLMAIAEKAMSTRNLATLMNIATSVLDKCETDLSIGNIQWYMEKFLSMSLDNVSFLTVPTTGAYIECGARVAYVFINVDEWLEMVNQFMNPYDNEIEEDECSIVIWTKQPELIGYNYFVDYKYLTTTDGTPVNDNFYIAP